MRRYCKRKQCMQKRCFVKSQSDLPIVIRANRAQPVFETLCFRITAALMAALYTHFRLAYKHLLHGNKINKIRLAYITVAFFSLSLFFFFFFFVGCASNAHCQGFNTSFINVSTLFITFCFRYFIQYTGTN